MCTVPRSLWLGRHGLHGSAVLPSRFCTLPELLGPSGLPECRLDQPLATEQSVCDSPCSRLPHAGWFMVTSRIVLVPNPLQSFLSADHYISLQLTTRLEPSVPIHPRLNPAASTA